MTRLEQNIHLFKVLRALGEGYETGDFSQFVTCIGRDCVFTDSNVYMYGYDAIADFYEGLGASISKLKEYRECRIAEMIGPSSCDKYVKGRTEYECYGHTYTAGKICLAVSKRKEGYCTDTVEMISVTLNDNGEIDKTDVLAPGHFRYRNLCVIKDADMEVKTSFQLYPGTEEWNENENHSEKWNDSEHRIVIGAAYHNEIKLFLGCIGIVLPVCEDCHIPMDKWINALEYWDTFASSDTYSDAYKAVGDAFCPDNTKEDDIVRAYERRNTAGVMLDCLKEWTDAHKDEYTYVNLISHKTK